MANSSSTFFQVLIKVGELNQQIRDMTNKNLTADLRHFDLSGADLSGSKLFGANFNGAKLTRTKLFGVIALDKAVGYKKPEQK